MGGGLGPRVEVGVGVDEDAVPAGVGVEVDVETAGTGTGVAAIAGVAAAFARCPAADRGGIVYNHNASIVNAVVSKVAMSLDARQKTGDDGVH